MSRRLTVELAQRSYPIDIGPGLLLATDWPQLLRGRPILVLSDENVASYYLDGFCTAAGLSRDRCFVTSPGEPSKSMAELERVLTWMLEKRLPRDGLLIALGGGVVGDLAGFSAAVYQRGIDFIQIPTSLLAQVDSSVGGKTGINHAAGKNLIGAFHQPIAVIADIQTLQTLPRRELLAGLAEVIKYGLLGDAEFFAWLELHLNELLALSPEIITAAIERCCQMKADIVAADEREAGQRALLNLGHTFGHAIEAARRSGCRRHVSGCPTVT